MMRARRAGQRLRSSGLAGLILAIPLLTGTPGLIVASSVATLVLGGFALVICPAIWSRNERRREDAKDVLRIFRRDR